MADNDFAYRQEDAEKRRRRREAERQRRLRHAREEYMKRQQEEKKDTPSEWVTHGRGFLRANGSHYITKRQLVSCRFC